MKKQVEDNPVPSLDEPYKSRIREPLTNEEFEAIKKSLNLTIGNKPALIVLLYKINRLQNGVETDNEQPFDLTQLPRFSDGTRPKLYWYKCITPTKHMTAGKLYQGYIHSHSTGYWGWDSIKLFHFIDDRGIHATCSDKRLKRQSILQK